MAALQVRQLPLRGGYFQPSFPRCCQQGAMCTQAGSGPRENRHRSPTGWVHTIPVGLSTELGHCRAAPCVPEIQRDLSDGVPAYTCSREPLIPKASRAHRILRPGCTVGKRRPGSSCKPGSPPCLGPSDGGRSPQHLPQASAASCPVHVLLCSPPASRPPGGPLSAPGAFQALLFKGPDASHR